MTFTPESNFNAFAYFGSHHTQYKKEAVTIIGSLLYATIHYDLRTNESYMSQLCCYYLGSDDSINIFVDHVQRDLDLYTPESLDECSIYSYSQNPDFNPYLDSFMSLIARDATFSCMYAALRSFRSEGVSEFESLYAKPPYQLILERREAINVPLETMVSLNFEEQFVLKCVPVNQDIDTTRDLLQDGLILFQWAIRTPKSYLYVHNKCNDIVFYYDNNEWTIFLMYLLNLVHYYAPRQMTERDRAALESRLRQMYHQFTSADWDLKELHELPIEANLDTAIDTETSKSSSGITLNNDVRKLDFIRVLYVLYELDFFVEESGKKVTKKELFAFLATWLNKESLKYYDKDMTNSWKSDMSAHIAIFDTMRSKMLELATNKNVANYKKIE